MKNDTKQDDPRYLPIFENIDAEVGALLAHKGYTQKIIGQDWVKFFLSAKKTLLKEKYNIEWEPEG